LYERKELLRVEEEKSWKIQEAMMKYGESGSSDEEGSGSGSDDETEEEEEEDCQVLLNRNPSKRQRQEEKPSQENVPLVPKVEGIPDTSSKDRFEHICNVLGEMQAEHRMRGELLREAMGTRILCFFALDPQTVPSQGTNFNNPVRFSNYSDRQLGCCFVCGDPNHYASNCLHRGPGQGAPLILPYRNCQEYGHQEGQCPKFVQPRPVYKQVEIIPRDQSGLNYGHSVRIENPEK
jgi:hypothetical protein